MKKLILFNLLFFLSLFCFSQNDYEITKSFIEWETNRVNKKRSPKEAHYKKINRALEITPHISVLGKDTVLSEGRLREILKIANEFFEPIGLSFTFCKTNFFHSKYYDTVSIRERNMNRHEVDQKHYEPYTINMYFVAGLEVGGGKNPGGYTTFPDSKDIEHKKDYVFVSVYDILTKEYKFKPSRDSNIAKIIAHELGHFFGLFHPHETDWNGDGIPNIELVDGSNCSIAGDLICDTPAEPNLYRLVDERCEYTGNAPLLDQFIKDPSGEPYIPSTTNIMSYVPFECMKGFTEQQFEKMVEVYYEFRTYLR